jgi:ribosome maturation factor RimP
VKQAPEHLLKLLEPVVEGLGYECVGIEFNAHPKNGLLRIYIDSDKGITVEDCSRVSHQVSGVLDVEDPINGEYNLEVSSPGADRPFFKLDQFRKHLGETIMVTLFSPINQRRKITGQIKEVQDDGIIVLDDGEQNYLIPLKAMSKARLVPEFSIK